MKKALLITPRFMGLDQLIFEELKKVFPVIDHRYDRKKNFLFKLFVRLNIPFLRDYISNVYYKNILISLDKCYDNAIIINPETMPESYLELIRNRSKKTTVYFWDGTVTKPKIKMYEKIKGINFFSFDKRDCEKFNFKYLPLFIPNNDIPKIKKNIELCFIASCHNKRLKLAHVLKQISREYSYNAVIRLNSSSILHYFFYNFLAIAKRYKLRVNLNSLSHEQYLEILSKTRIVVDMTSDPNQAGVSLRTFESLGQGCKLLTNNYYLEHEEFYDESLIYFYTGFPTKHDIDKLLSKNFPMFNAKKFRIDNFIRVLVD
jgi:hypothetical protein